MTAPATRPNQSKPATAVVTSRAVDRSQPPSSSTSQPATTPHCTSTMRHAVEHGLHPVLADGRPTRPPSTARRWRWTAGVAAASLTVRADSSADTSERPNCARAVDDGRGGPAGDGRAERGRGGRQHHHGQQHAAGEQAAAGDGGEQRR